MLGDEYQDCSSIHYDENDDDTNTLQVYSNPLCYSRHLYYLSFVSFPFLYDFNYSI